LQLSRIMMPVNQGSGFKMENYWVWCASVVKGEDGQYHMFASRWKKDLPFHPGWLLGSEVVRAVSKDPQGPYKFAETVLPDRGAQFWDGKITHNPHIIKHQGRYLLFYTGSTHPFSDSEVQENTSAVVTVARAGKRIGIAVADSVYGPWKRFDKPAIDVDCHGFDNFLTSNAAPCVLDNGDILVVYKTRSYKTEGRQLHSNMMLCACVIDKSTFEVKKRGTAPLFDSIELEDPFVWKEGGKFYMIAKDMTGEVCGQKQGGIIACSGDGFEWKAQKGALCYSRTLKFADGKEKTMGNLERPFILFENGKMTHAFFAASDGTGSGFDNVTETYSVSIPLNPCINAEF